MESIGDVPKTLAPTGAYINQQANAAVEDEQDKYFDFSLAKVHLVRTIHDWDTEREDTEVRRKTRDVEVDVEGLRQKGDLEEDETLIPDRVIDENITREQPPYINYLKNSRRLCVFNCVDRPEQDSELVEQEFTRGMTYCKWETPHFKCLDGAQTHGWDAVEVVYDPSKPVNVGIEQIGHDQLAFPRSSIDLQQAPRVMRKYDVSIIQLRKWVKEFGFDSEQVEMLIDRVRDTQKETETIKIWKLYFKKDSIVYVSWFEETFCSDWLKKPTKLFLGISHKTTKLQMGPDGMSASPVDSWEDSDIKIYPIFILNYKETEKPKIMDHKGRVFLDENKQEAQTAILSGFINGLTRASNVYASPDQEDGTGSSLREIKDVKLVNGRIMSRPMKWFAPPYPDPMVIKALQYFDVSNSQETGQVNFATMNRDDSRKTAKEITASQEQQSLLNSVQLTMFSTYIREVYSFVWLIVQSQALQSKIIFLPKVIQTPMINPMTGQPAIDPQSGQPATQSQVQNDFDTISLTWDVRAAGDTDVILKQEIITSMQQDMPWVMNTPLRDQFLADYVRLKYPAKGEKYAMILSQSGMMQSLKSLVARLGTVLEGTFKQNPQMLQELPAQQQSDVAQMIQESKQVMGQQ